MKQNNGKKYLKNNVVRVVGAALVLLVAALQAGGAASALSDGSAAAPSDECLLALGDLRERLTAQPVGPEAALLLAVELAGEPCGFQPEILSAPPTNDAVDIINVNGGVCKGAGAGEITGTLIVLGVPVPLLDEPAAGDFNRAGAVSEIDSSGATLGLESNGVTTIMRIGSAFVPTVNGDANTTCGAKVSEVCKTIKFLWIEKEVCADVVTPIACSSTGWGAIGASGILTFQIDTDLTNPIGCDQVDVDLGSLLEGGDEIALLPMVESPAFIEFSTK